MQERLLEYSQKGEKGASMTRELNLKKAKSVYAALADYAPDEIRTSLLGIVLDPKVHFCAVKQVTSITHEGDYEQIEMTIIFTRQKR